MKAAILAASLIAAAHGAHADAAADYVGLAGSYLTTMDQSPDLTDLSGEWLMMSQLSPEAPAAPEDVTRMLERFCGGNTPTSLVIEAVSDVSMTMSQQMRDVTYTEGYHWAGGHRFLREGNMDATIERLGLAGMAPEKLRPMRQQIVRQQLATVDILRPAPDMLVLMQDGIAGMLIRCPAG
ncbi:hypothetical protein [Gemmobacter sp. 24YEA27]|uniref:hypothetical protein n=1 Tax=Gemmobacter sp. 24YEA27 TaxID=3040672 RepID=UPI0024B33799|nr:hypothetical protein [Gemmobacter sp. 24YEA27]